MARILIVDDQTDIRRLLRITLGSKHEVTEAETGEQALASARSQRPDLILLDRMMPGAIDGLALLDLVRGDAAFAKTRVILLTARGELQDVTEGKARGADAYVVKPFSPVQLLALVDDVLAS